MSKRATILIEDSTEKKIRTFQAKMIKTTNQNYSYSAAINEILKRGL